MWHVILYTFEGTPLFLIMALIGIEGQIRLEVDNFVSISHQMTKQDLLEAGFMTAIL